MVTKERAVPNGINQEGVIKLQGGIRLPRVGYDIAVFSEEAFLRNQEPLTKIVVGFAQRELGWSEEAASMVYTKALKTEDLMGDPKKESEIPSVMLFRKEGMIVGVSAQRLKYIETHQVGVVPVIYHILRGFEQQYRDEGMGRESVGLVRILHRKGKYYAARNGGPVPVWATMQADIFEPGTYHPWDSLYDVSENDLLYQKIMAELHMDIRTNGTWVNGSTGVSIADYPEYNHSYMPRLDHAPTVALLRRMEGKKIKEGELGMVIRRGDSVISLGKIRE